MLDSFSCGGPTQREIVWCSSSLVLLYWDMQVCMHMYMYAHSTCFSSLPFPTDSWLPFVLLSHASPLTIKNILSLPSDWWAADLLCSSWTLYTSLAPSVDSSWWQEEGFKSVGGQETYFAVTSISRVSSGGRQTALITRLLMQTVLQSCEYASKA